MTPIRLRTTVLFFSLAIFLAACTASSTPELGRPTPPRTPEDGPSAAVCAVTEPEWAKPPEDAAVQDPPAFDYYYVNRDRSMWASAWWVGQPERDLRWSEEGVKVGWFRPAGAALQITGRRLDAEAPPLRSEASCCYPTRFQASDLYFPTPGCWQVTARAAQSELSFILKLAP